MNPDQTIFRAVKSRDFTTFSNSLLRDTRLSFKARGVLVMCLSNAEDWKVHRNWLVNQGQEGREAIQGALQELEKYGYVRYVEVRRGGKFISSVWEFHEVPVTEKTDRTNWSKSPLDGKPANGKPANGFPSPKKDYQTEEDQKERAPALKLEAEEPKKKTFTPPTLLQVTTHLQQLGYTGHAPSEAQAFIDHHEARGWFLSKGVKMKSWEAAVGTWKRNAEKFSKPNGAAVFTQPKQVRMSMQ